MRIRPLCLRSNVFRASGAEFNRELLDHKIIGGLALGRFYPELADCTLVCATEMTRRAPMDQFKKCVETIREPELALRNGGAR